MLGLLGILLLWGLIAPAFALAFAVRAQRSARELAARIAVLEARLAGGPTSKAEPVPEPATAAETPHVGAITADQPAAPIPELLSPSEPEPPRPDSTSPAIATPDDAETLESKIGGRWSVLVGGLALALGAVFLVRYSIERGLLGPGMRVVLGILLAGALLSVGEFLRRRDRALDIPALAKADVPAILTGAGAIAAFATIYAAYALYGFISDAAAFVLLTAAGLATLFLSVVHGPALAALGVLGSYAAPLLVSSAEPKPFPVVLHTLAVTAAVLTLARIRGWRWLAVAGVAASLGWGVLTGLIVNVNTAAAELLLAACLALTFTGALISGRGPVKLRDDEPDAMGLGALAGLAALTVYFALVTPAYPPLVSGILLAGALGAIASRWPAMAGAALIAGVLAVLTVMLIRVPGSAAFDSMQIGALQWRILGVEGLGAFALKAAAIAALVGIGGFLTSDRMAGAAPRGAGVVAAAGAAAPLLILVVVYLRHVPFETRPAVGIAALILAAVYAAAAERLIARRPADFSAPGPALYAAGAVLAPSFAMSVGLAARFVPLALSLGAAGVVWVFLLRPVKILPWLAVLCAALASIALIAGPPLSVQEVGTTPLLNGLVLRFGLPAAALLVAGETLRRRRDSLEAALLQASGLALSALFIAFEIRHLSNDGLLAAGVPGLGEQSAYTLAALAFSLGLQRVARETRSEIYRAASLIAGVLGAAQITLAHFITANPVVTNEHIGDGVLFNLLLPGYLLPALLAAWVATAARGVRPRWYVVLFAALALALGFAYVTLMVRHVFHGPRLGALSVRDAENWTYSAVWLGLGIALLLAGIWRGSVMVRAASGLIIAAVVCKVFLLDMAALTGALRAASFLGLGAVLIAIGRLYQRLLTRGRPGAVRSAAT